MENVDHFYLCLGCGRRHATEAPAKTCCAVVQEVWQCRACETLLPSESRARRHLATEHPERPIKSYGGTATTI
jgi:hypothetical protein